jgi:aspartyl-tRNA synthetase
MSFVDQELIKDLTEQMLKFCWPDFLSLLKTPFPRMTYGDAIKKYGTDKPDTRFKMKASTTVPLY